MTTNNDFKENVLMRVIHDITSVSITVATLMSWLPPMAALFSIIWSAIRIYETKTIQRWLGKIDVKTTSE